MSDFPVIPEDVSPSSLFQVERTGRFCEIQMADFEHGDIARSGLLDVDERTEWVARLREVADQLENI